MLNLFGRFSPKLKDLQTLKPIFNMKITFSYIKEEQQRKIFPILYYFQIPILGHGVSYSLLFATVRHYVKGFVPEETAVTSRSGSETSENLVSNKSEGFIKD